MYIYLVMSVGKNTGIRAPIQSQSEVDVHIAGFAVETNDPEADTVDNNTVNQYTVHYVLEGRGTVIIDGVVNEVHKDDFFVTFPNLNIQLRQDPVCSWTIGWIVCDGLKVRDYLRRIGITPKKCILSLKPDKELRTLFSKTPYSCIASPDFSDIIALGAFFDIIARISDQLPKRERRTLRTMEEQHVASAIEYINRNYQNPSLNLTMVASAVCISPKYLSNIFRRVTGISFTHHLVSKRIAAAADLIAGGETVVSVIAEECGFSSPYYFSNVFRRYNTDSPKKHIARRIKNQKTQTDYIHTDDD